MKVITKLTEKTVKFVTENGKEFKNKNDALEYIFNKKFTEKFPLCHVSDTQFEIHCILCSKIILEYERIYDGHRNEKGDLIFKQQYNKLFGSYYCGDCYKKIERKIKEFLIKYYQN